MDLFTSNNKGRICVHEATGQPCIVVKAEWMKKNFTSMYWYHSITRKANYFSVTLLTLMMKYCLRMNL